MKKQYPDTTDMSLIRCLTEDGRASAKDLAEKLAVTPPTVYARIKNLIGSGVLKITGLVDIFKISHVQSAIVAINVNDDSRLPEIMDKLSNIPGVQWVAAVTGRYDIFVEVILPETMESLFQLHTETLSKLEGVSSSESFVIMKTKNKWFTLPPGFNGQNHSE